MTNSELDRLRLEIKTLTASDRTILARELTASPEDSSDHGENKSDFQIRMRSYVHHAWVLASRTLSVR